MKNLVITAFLLGCTFVSFAQIGVGTTSPNSTLDVRGSLSIDYRSFTGATTAGTDYTLVFTGTSAATLTLPDATTIQGRMYWVKNASSNGSTLTIATSLLQTIDGASSWALSQTYKVVAFVSNGTNWYSVSESVPGNTSGSAWVLGGNNTGSVQDFGTTSSYDVPFITANTEKMRLTTGGSLGIGTTSFSSTNPERLIADAGSNGAGAYQNVIVGKGNTNSYAQLNIQNTYSGANNSASSDVVATSDNGTESVDYIDMGINSGSNTSTGIYGGNNTAYLYSTGNDFAFGNATSGKNLLFFTGGTASSNERMRIDGSGNVGIGTTTIPKGSVGMAKVAIEGVNGSSSGPHMQFTTASDNYPLLQILPWQHDNVSFTFDGYWDGSTWRSSTTTGGNFNFFKSSGNFSIRYANINTQGGAISSFSDGIVLNTGGNVGINTSAFNASYPEQLLVDAGATGNTNYQNVLVGKGNTNSYAQLNIQNSYSGAGNSASSDVVATSDNGNESVNYIDMGINSGTNTSTGIYGGNNTAYLYSAGNDFAFGNATSGKNLLFFTGGTASADERMRITGTGNVGINTTSPNSTLEANGSVAYPITSTSASITLDATNYTVIITSTSASVTLPAASSSNARRIYVIVNQTVSSRTISSYKNFSNTGTTTVAANSSITIQSDGTNWYRIQ